MRIHLGGHLDWYDIQKRSWLTLHIPEPISLPGLAQQLGLPAAEIAIVVVNGRAVTLDLEGTTVTDHDKVEFYPPLSGG